MLGIICIAAYGAGLGLAVPAANLVVAEVNPQRRSATLNLLNFSWSAGAVACPFLIAAAAKVHRIPLFLAMLAGFLLLVAIGIAAMPSTIVEPATTKDAGGKSPVIRWTQPSLLILAALFFLYVGTENAFGGWVASYSKSLGSLSPAMALMTPSFFYFALMLGRWIAPLALRVMDEVRLVQAGTAARVRGNGGIGSVAFAAERRGQRLGCRTRPLVRVSHHHLAIVARVRPGRVARWIADVLRRQPRRWMPALDGRRRVDSIRHAQGGTRRAPDRKRRDVHSLSAQVEAGQSPNSQL